MKSVSISVRSDKGRKWKYFDKNGDQLWSQIENSDSKVGGVEWGHEE